MPGFAVQMGFGLHVGWAIEGPIGAVRARNRSTQAARACMRSLAFSFSFEAASAAVAPDGWRWFRRAGSGQVIRPQGALPCRLRNPHPRLLRRHPPKPGSRHKVDASYLSPNVNMAARLEAATKQYGVPLLMSSDFVACLSPSVRARVRGVGLGAQA
jgi:hypothetical protein